MMYADEDYLDAATRLCERPLTEVYALDAEQVLQADTVDGSSQMSTPGAWVRCWMYVTDDQVTAIAEQKDYERQLERMEGDR